MMTRLMLPDINRSPVQIRGGAWAVTIAPKRRKELTKAFVIKHHAVSPEHFGKGAAAQERARAFGTPHIVPIVIEGTPTGMRVFNPADAGTITALGGAGELISLTLYYLGSRGIKFEGTSTYSPSFPRDVGAALGDHTIHTYAEYILPQDRLNVSNPLVPYVVDTREIEQRETWRQNSVNIAELFRHITGVSHVLRRRGIQRFEELMDEAVIKMGFKVRTTDTASGTVEFLAYGNVLFRLTPESLERIENKGRRQ